MTYHIENPISLIAFHVFLAWDRAYILIACLSYEGHLRILYGPFFGFGCAKEGSPHSESFSSLRTPSKTCLSNSLLNISLCTLVTG